MEIGNATAPIEMLQHVSYKSEEFESNTAQIMFEILYQLVQMNETLKKLGDLG